MGGCPDELLRGRADAVRARAQARRHGARAPRSSRRRSPSSPATSTQCSTGRASPHRTSPGVAALLTQRHPVVDAAADEVGADVDRRPRRSPTPSLTQEASVLVEGAGLVSVGAADRPLIFTDPQSLSFGYLVRGRRREQQVDLRQRVRRRRRRRHVGRGGAASGRVRRARPSRPRPVTLAPGGTAVDADHRPRVRPARCRETTSGSSSSARKRRAPDPVRVLGLALVADGCIRSRR